MKMGAVLGKRMRKRCPGRFRLRMRVLGMKREVVVEEEGRVGVVGRMPVRGRFGENGQLNSFHFLLVFSFSSTSIIDIVHDGTSRRF